MLGQNIKVHFAGSDYSQSVIDSLEIAQVHYRLFTVYPVIANKTIAQIQSGGGMIKQAL